MGGRATAWNLWSVVMLTVCQTKSILIFAERNEGRRIVAATKTTAGGIAQMQTIPVPIHVRPLLRVMLSFGESMFGILVTTAGLIIRFVYGRHRYRLTIGRWTSRAESRMLR